MVNRFISMEYSHIVGDGFHFYWAFYSKQVIPIRRGCRILRPVECSMMTRIFPDSQMNKINPEEFFNYCCKDASPLGKVLIVPNDAAIVLPEKGWKLCEREDDPSWDYTLQAELLDKSKTPDFPNLVILSKRRKPRIIQGPKAELEKYRSDAVESERYDDYRYVPDEEGNLWCNGISMKEDIDSCCAWQESHPGSDECKNCTSLCKVHF